MLEIVGFEVILSHYRMGKIRSASPEVLECMLYWDSMVVNTKRMINR